jgi:hypothetical protein
VLPASLLTNRFTSAIVSDTDIYFLSPILIPSAIILFTMAATTPLSSAAASSVPSALTVSTSMSSGSVGAASIPSPRVGVATSIGAASSATSASLPIPPLHSTSGSPPSTGAEVVLKSGYLQKKAENILRNFHKRYFVLTPSSLSYYESEKQYLEHDHKHGSMSIKRAALRDGDDVEKEFLLVDQKHFYIRAADKKEKDEWLEAIREAKAKQEQQNAPAVETFDDDDVKEDSEARNRTAANNHPATATTATATPHSISSTLSYSSTGNGGSSVSLNAGTMSRQSSAGTPLTPTAHSATATTAAAPHQLQSPVVIAAGAEQRREKMVDDARRLESKKEPSKELSEKLMKRVEKSRKCQDLFGWPSETLLLKDVACGLEQQIVLYGRLYITNHYLGFYSSIFQGAKVSLKVEDIQKIEKANSALVFPNALRIFMKADRVPNGGVSNYFLTAFALGNRNKTYSLISALIQKSFDIETFDWSWKEMEKGGDPGKGSAACAEDDEEEGTFSSNSQSIAPTPVHAALAGEGATLLSPSSAAAAAIAAATSVADNDDSEELPQRKLLRAATHLDMAVRPKVESETSGELVCAINVRLPVSTAQFFHIFLDNTALYSFEDFHAQRQDMEFNMSLWKKASGIVKDADDNTFVRDISLVVKVKDSPMGPDQTRVMKVQKRSHSFNGQGKMNKLKMETNQVIPDVPFGSCFHVLDRWFIEDIEDGAACQVKVDVGLIFDEMPWKLKMIKGMVESRTIADLKKEKEEWTNKAKTWIEEHTEEMKIIKRKLPATPQQANAVAAPHGNTLAPEPKRSQSAPDKTATSPAPRSSESPAPLPSSAPAPRPPGSSSAAASSAAPAASVQGLLFPLGPLAPLGSPLAEFVLLMVGLYLASLLPGPIGDLSYEGVVVYLLLAILFAMKKRKTD